jgi:dTMP kinase
LEVTVFITFEGGEGVGKTTQIRLIKDALELKGHSVTMTREPGGTSIGDQTRAILLDAANSKMHPITELHLFHAQRSQHVRELIWPALKRGEIVLCDRFADSTIVYQGFARDVMDPVTIVHQTEALLEFRWPDHTIIFTHPNPVIPLERARARWKPVAEPTNVVQLNEARFDMMTLKLHLAVFDTFENKLEALFREMGLERHRNFDYVDASGSSAEVAVLALKSVEDALSRKKDSEANSRYTMRGGSWR